MDINSQNAVEVARICKELLDEFPENEIKLKPAKVSGNRCLALAYIDARLVLDRLDKVVGINNWRDEYTLLHGGEVECRLSLRIAGEWITKADVGGQSEQPDDGDKMKAAYSDALKRAAVKFGIGRFLYRRAQQWMDYDPVKKQIIRPGTGQQPPKPAPTPAVSASAREIATAFDTAGSRAEGVAPYNRYDAAFKDGKVNEVDKWFIDQAIARFVKKYPKQPATAKA